jgi:hypothetical protein
MGEPRRRLLEISRLDAGNLRLDLRPFSLAEVGGRVLGALAPLALERGIDLRSDLPPRMRRRRRPTRGPADPDEPPGNALKFTPEGGHVELAAASTAPSRSGRPRRWAGVSPTTARIFDRFFRVDAQAAVSGTGLGLAIARDLARAMGGDLAVASVHESGSSFVLVLPGPAQVGLDSVGSVLERALADEEVLLEEAAVLRAIRSSNRPSSFNSRARGRASAPRSRAAAATRPAAGDRRSVSRSEPPNPA